MGRWVNGVLVHATEDRSVPWSFRIRAASLVADRAFGRAPQSVSPEVTRRLNDPTLDELRQLEARLARQTAADNRGHSRRRSEYILLLGLMSVPRARRGGPREAPALWAFNPSVVCDCQKIGRTLRW
jgi:hypothetical protein